MEPQKPTELRILQALSQHTSKGRNTLHAELAVEGAVFEALHQLEEQGCVVSSKTDKALTDAHYMGRLEYKLTVTGLQRRRELEGHNLKRYIILRDFKVYFLLMGNEKIEQKEISQILSARKTNLPSNIEVITRGEFEARFL